MKTPMPARSRLIVPVAVALLAGCSAMGPRFVDEPAPADKARVYIYRPDSMAFKARSLGVEVNATRVATLKNNGYLVFDVPPGAHDVKIGWDTWIGDGAIDRPITGRMKVSAGTRYYLRFSTSATNAPGSTPGTITQTMRWGLRAMPPAAALPEIKETNRVDLDKRPPDAPPAAGGAAPAEIPAGEPAK